MLEAIPNPALFYSKHVIILINGSKIRIIGKNWDKNTLKQRLFALFPCPQADFPSAGVVVMVKYIVCQKQVPKTQEMRVDIRHVFNRLVSQDPVVKPNKL